MKKRSHLYIRFLSPSSDQAKDGNVHVRFSSLSVAIALLTLYVPLMRNVHHHATLAACYQLVQFILKIDFAPAKNVQ